MRFGAVTENKREAKRTLEDFGNFPLWCAECDYPGSGQR
jgi:hypothetical protein